MARRPDCEAEPGSTASTPRPLGLSHSFQESFIRVCAVHHIDVDVDIDIWLDYKICALRHTGSLITV